MYTVYIHANKINHKVYVGITNRDINERWGKEGHGYLKKQVDGNSCQPVFAKAIQKYGWDSFEHIIFADNISEQEAKHMEVMLIALYKSNCCRYNNPSYGYNMTDGGEGVSGNKQSEETKNKKSIALMRHPVSEETIEKLKKSHIGKRLTEEQKEKISNAMRGDKHPNYGKPMSEEQKEKLRKANTGKKHTEETKQKMSQSAMGEKNSFYGKHHSEETKKRWSEMRKRENLSEETIEKMRQAQMGRKASEETRKKLSEKHKKENLSEDTIKKMSDSHKGANNYNFGRKFSEDRLQKMHDNNPNKIKAICVETGICYDGLKQAGRETGISYTQISNCCKHKPHCLTAGGYHWLYYSEYIEQQEVAV